MSAPTRKARLVLIINDTRYVIKPLGADASPTNSVRAFTMTRDDSGRGKVTHTVAETIEGLFCTCGDQTYRQRSQGTQCKHLAAAVACGLF